MAKTQNGRFDELIDNLQSVIDQIKGKILRFYSAMYVIIWPFVRDKGDHSKTP